VDNGQLVVSRDESATSEERYSRAFFPFDRLVVLGAHGYVTLAALRWLADVSASFVHIDSIGRVTATSAPTRLDDARLRRHQALAPYTPIGLEIARTLITDKLQGQATTLEQLGAPTQSVTDVLSALDAAFTGETLTELRMLEAAAASVYWEAWAAVPLRFASRDKPRLPKHWLTVGQRTSPLTASPRRAATPAHAILNLMYAVLESEARIACLTIGLDPGLGILHYDQRNRGSFALDLMEPARPQIDGQLLRLVTSHSFRRADFFEAPDGTCRIEPTLARQICLTTHAREALAGHAERVAKMLAAARVEPPETFRLGDGFHVPTRLSQAHRSDGRDGIRRRQKRSPSIPKPRLAATCVDCGRPLGDPRRRAVRRLPHNLEPGSTSGLPGGRNATPQGDR
jgi:CRISPR-associated protein Cas1